MCRKVQVSRNQCDTGFTRETLIIIINVIISWKINSHTRHYIVTYKLLNSAGTTRCTLFPRIRVWGTRLGFIQCCFLPQSSLLCFLRLQALFSTPWRRRRVRQSKERGARKKHIRMPVERFAICVKMYALRIMTSSRSSRDIIAFNFLNFLNFIIYIWNLYTVGSQIYASKIFCECFIIK